MDWQSAVQALLLYPVGPMVLLAGLATWLSPQRRVAYAVLFGAVCVLDVVALVLPLAMHWLTDTLHWNWLGKLLGIVLGLLVLRLSPLTLHEVGLTLKQRPNSFWHGLFIIVLVAAAQAYRVTPESITYPIETLAFQATMPSLAEELLSRGVLLALLVRALGGDLGDEQASNRRAVLASAAILIFAFGLGHIWQSLATGDWSTDVLSTLLYTSFAGLILTWLRLRTGSLLLPMLCHSTINLAWVAKSLLSLP